MVIRGCWPRRPADRPRPGRQPRLADVQRSEVEKWVEDGPDLKTDGVVRWRCADLRDHIAAKFNVHLHNARWLIKPMVQEAQRRQQAAEEAEFQHVGASRAPAKRP
jgi:transposase